MRYIFFSFLLPTPQKFVSDQINNHYRLAIGESGGRRLAGSASSMGAGSAISLGKKIRALTATKDTKKIRRMIKGLTCSRKKAIVLTI